MTNFTTAAELKVGQRLADGTDYRDLGLGQSIEKIVTKITITKSGRYAIEYSHVYVYANGERKFTENNTYSHKGVKGNTIIVLF